MIVERSRPVDRAADRPEVPGWVITAAVGVATALAAWFALWHLGREPFGRDEVASVTDAHRSLSGTFEVIRHREGNMWPYYLLLNGWVRIGGTGEAWVRLPAALCAVAAVPALMVLARRMFGNAAAIIAGVVLACSPMLMDVAQFARSYGIVALLVVASSLLFVDGIERPRRRTWVLWGLVSGAMVHFHMLASLIVVAQVASLALLPTGAVPWRHLLAGTIALAVLAAPMVVYAATGDSGQTSWIAAITPHAIAGFGKAAAGSRLLELLDGVLFAAAALALIATLRARGRSPDAWRQGLVLLWVALPPLALAALSLVKPLFSPTYLIGVVPGLALLVGMIATAGTWRRMAPAAAALVALVTLATQIDRTHPTPATEDLRGAASFVASRTQPGDGIAYAPAFARPGFAFYFDRDGTPGHPKPTDLDQQPGETPQALGDLFGGEASTAQVAANLRSARRVWLVGYPGANWHPTPEPVLAAVPAILRTTFTRTTTRRFGEFVVQLYRHR
jgi:mannosyltransferase